MKKETLVMVSGKVLNQMIAYRKHVKYYASYREACESIETDIEKFHKDSFRVSLMQHNIQTSPSVFVRSFQSLLVSVAAKCLLTAGECGRTDHLLYNEIFDTFFEVVGEMMDRVVESGNQDYDTTILESFDNFKAGVESGYANTVLLYRIAAFCLFLHNYIEVNSRPLKIGGKVLVTVTPAGIKLNGRIYFDAKLRDYLHQEVFVHITPVDYIIDVYTQDDFLICSAHEIHEMVEVGK